MLKEHEKEKLEKEIVNSLRGIYKLDDLINEFKEEYIRISDFILNESEYSEGLKYISSREPDLLNLTKTIIYCFDEIGDMGYLGMNVSTFSLPKSCFVIQVDEYEKLKEIKKKFENNYKVALNKAKYVRSFLECSDNIDLRTLKKYSPKLYKLLKK